MNRPYGRMRKLCPDAVGADHDRPALRRYSGGRGKSLPYGICNERRRPVRSFGGSARRRQMKDVLQSSMKMNQKLHKKPGFRVFMKKTAKK